MIMLKIFKPYEMRDYLRTFQSRRGHGLPIAPNYIALQWEGAYSEENTIIYFIARKIDGTKVVKESYDLETTLIKYENGQYLYDDQQLYGGYLPDGVYFFEFNDGVNTFFSQVFKVQDYEELMKASGAWLASSDVLISELNISMPNQIILRRFEYVGEYYIFENL